MPAEKICVICKEDCSARPRLKDSNGQYACQACVEAKQRPRQAPKAKAPPAAAPIALEDAPDAGGGIGFSMDDYLGDAPSAASADPASHCPNCGAAKAAGAVVCMQCGFDSASGKAMSTKVRKAKPQKTRRAPRVSSGAAYIVIALSMLVLLPALALTSPEGASVALGVAGLWALVAYVYMIGAAFRDGDKFWAILGVLFWVPLAGFFCWLAFVLYYCTIGSQRGVRKLNYWAAFFAFWIIFAILASSNPDLLPARLRASEP